jgi:FlaA1/EpsC-like NDP-sugar epimerase
MAVAYTVPGPVRSIRSFDRRAGWTFIHAGSELALLGADLQEIADYVTGHVVLVTGAGGSIGSEFARQVRRLGPSKLILLDRDESGLHGAQLLLYGSGLLDTDDMVLCDIRDYAALQAVFDRHRPDAVFHAAALKHLPMSGLWRLFLSITRAPSD